MRDLVAQWHKHHFAGADWPVSTQPRVNSKFVNNLFVQCQAILRREVELIVRLSRLGLCVLVYLRVYSPSSGFRFGLSRTSGLISGEVVPRSLVFLGAQHPSTSVQLFLLYIISPKTRASKCYRGDWYDVQQPSLYLHSFYLILLKAGKLRNVANREIPFQPRCRCKVVGQSARRPHY